MKSGVNVCVRISYNNVLRFHVCTVYFVSKKNCIYMYVCMYADHSVQITILDSQAFLPTNNEFVIIQCTTSTHR